MRKVMILLAVVAMLALAMPAYAETIEWTGLSATDATDFHDGDNWSDDGTWTGAPAAVYADPPGTLYADVGEITGGTLAIISGNAYVRRFHVGGTIYEADGPSEVRMAAGDYTVSAQKPNGDGCLRIGAWGSSSNLGTFTQYGGDLVVGNHSSAAVISLEIGGGQDSGNGYGEYTIYGGSIDADYLSLGRKGGTGFFTVVGSGSTGISVDKYTMSSNSTLTFEINGNSTTGIETIVVVTGGDDDGNVEFAGADSIVVDNSAGGPFAASYVLMSWSATATETGTPSLDLPADWTWNSTSWATDNNITVTVPEPATLALLSIGGIGVLIRRRRR